METCISNAFDDAGTETEVGGAMNPPPEFPLDPTAGLEQVTVPPDAFNVPLSVTIAVETTRVPLMLPAQEYGILPDEQRTPAVVETLTPNVPFTLKLPPMEPAAAIVKPHVPNPGVLPAPKLYPLVDDPVPVLNFVTSRFPE
jgi:hypothetical protein